MPIPKLLTVLSACLIALLAAPAAHAYKPLTMGIHDPQSTRGAAGPFDLQRAVGATLTRRQILWRELVTGGATKPAGFDARNPGDPNYDWSSLDAFVQAGAARDLDPIITSYGAPDWAEGDDEADRANRFGDPGTYHPNPGDYGDFVFALATRYSGRYTPPGASGPLPRVRY